MPGLRPGLAGFGGPIGPVREDPKDCPQPTEARCRMLLLVSAVPASTLLASLELQAIMAFPLLLVIMENVFQWPTLD